MILNNQILNLLIEKEEFKILLKSLRVQKIFKSMKNSKILKEAIYF